MKSQNPQEIRNFQSRIRSIKAVMSGVPLDAVAAEVTTESAAPVEAAAPVKEKEAFDLKIKAVDAKAKIKVIKEVRVITGLGLKEVRKAVYVLHLLVCLLTCSSDVAIDVF